MLRNSLSKHAGIVAVLYALLASIAVIVVDLRVVLIPTACAVVGLVAVGFVVFPLRSGVAIRWPAQSEPHNEAGTIVINNESCPFLGYEQELFVEVRVRHLAELLACLLLAAATLYVNLSGPAMDASGFFIGPYEAELACIAGAFVLLASLRWFSERCFLRSSRIRLGTILAVDPGFYRRGVTYQFFDDKQERRGGRGSFPDGNDNVVLVLYNQRDPDINTIHGEFFFHAFRIGLLPGRRKATTEAGVQS